MTDDDFLSIEPWPISELVGHLVAQVTLGRRAFIETDDSSDAFERETDRFELEAWARLELTPWLTVPEFEYLLTAVGELDETGLAACEQGLIIASTIGWALYLTGCDELPAYSDGSSEMAVLDWAPTPWSPVRGVVKGVRIHADEALAKERERWDVLYWRSTLFHELDFMAEDQSAWAEAIPEIVEANLWPIQDNDLLVGDDLVFGNVAGDDLVALQEDAELRLRTLNWVCGYGERPTTAPIDLEGIDPSRTQ